MMTPSKTTSSTTKTSNNEHKPHTNSPSLFGAVLRKCFLSQSDYDATSEPALKPLKSYRYIGIDRSFISRYILTPYWNACVKAIPHVDGTQPDDISGIFVNVIHYLGPSLYMIHT